MNILYAMEQQNINEIDHKKNNHALFFVFKNPEKMFIVDSYEA